MNARIGTAGRWLLTFTVAAGALGVAGCATASLQGQSDLRAGRPAEARRHFQDALARRPERLDALAGLAVAEYKLGAFDEALPLFERVVTGMPRSGEVHLYLGLTHLHRGDLERAAEVHDARTAPRAWLEPTWVIYSDSHAVLPHVHGVP